MRIAGTKITEIKKPWATLRLANTTGTSALFRLPHLSEGAL